VSDETAAPASRGRGVLVWLLVCVVVGLAVRLAAVAVPQCADSITLAGKPVTWWADRPFFDDSLEYMCIARNLRSGAGLAADQASRIARMPGYPVFLATVQILFGDGYLPARVADALVGTLCIALAWLLARELFGPAEACVAAAVVAVYPFFVLFAVLVLSEVLFMALLLGGALAVARAYGRGGRVRAAVAGVVFGLATLVRASFLPVPVLTAGVWALTRKRHRDAPAQAGIMIAVFALCLVPWALRNWAASDGHLVVTTLRSGLSLYEGLNREADGGPMIDKIMNWPEARVDTREMSEVEKDRFWRRAALSYAAENPGRVLVLAGVKFVRFWNVVPNLAQFRKPLFCTAVGVPYVLVMLFAFGGFARARRRGDAALTLVLPVVYYALLHVVFVGSVRYRVAIMPLVIVLASHGVVGLWSRWRRGRSATDRDRTRLQREGHGSAASGAGAGGADGEADHRGG